MNMLSRHGKIKVCKDENGCSAVEKYDWKDTLIDSGIVSGIAAGSMYTALLGTGVSDMIILRACLMAAFIAFFGFLAIKRGLVTKKSKD
jgi:hypothetical protein